MALRMERPPPESVITSLTSICRLRAEADPHRARAALTAVPEDVHSPFAASPRTHFGRLLVLDELMVHERLPLGAPVMVLSADFDGDDAASYLTELLEDNEAGTALAEVLDLCEGAPADPSHDSFAADATRYLLDRRIEIGLQYVNDPLHHSAEQVRRAVDRHRRLVGFLRGHQSDPPADLRRAFRRTFAPSGAPVP